MSKSTEIQSIELNIQQAKKLVEFGLAVERLRSNRDFKTVISTGYFEDEAVRLVHLKADPNMQTDAYQLSIIKQMDAIGALAQFFQTVYQRANLAEKAIAADEEMITELLVEDVE